MNTVLVILAIVIVTLTAYVVDWRTMRRRWNMLRAKQQVAYLMYMAIGLLGAALLLASLLV